MAGTFESSKGIVKWAANIKTRLANDSTRNAFKELVQVQGFLFLEEYLEEVQRGPTQSAVVEIAKTPGRKKDLPKKTRAAVAAASARKLRIASSNDKENQVPANTAVTLQQALLNAQKDKANGMDDNDDRIQPSPKKRNPLTVSIVVPSQSEGHSPAPPQQTPATHHLPIAEPTPQSLPSITEREEEADRRAVSPPLPTPAKENVSEPDVPVAASAKITEDEPISATPLQSAVTARANGKVAPSQIPTPKPISTAEPTVRPSTPIRSPVTRATSPLARATSPLASRLGSSINGLRSPSPTKVMKGTPGSPAFVTRIPRSPKLGFQVGSAPLPNPPRSPLALRKDLALSGPEVTNFSSVGTSNPAASIRPSNAGEGALPPAPKVRSSFLQRQPHDGPSLLGGGKKSMGGALVAKKSVAGAGALLTSTAGSTVTKWKADLELVESAEKGFKPTKSTYERESVAVLQRKRKSEVDDEENSGHAMRKSKILKSSHGAPSRAAAQEFDSDDDEYEGDEFMKLRETVGNLKRQKSLHLVDIDITTRLNVKIPPPPAAIESASPIVPSRGSTSAESSTATQPAAERHSRSHERLSISELMSSTEQRKAEVVQAPLSGKDSQPSAKAAKAAAAALAKKEFTLLMASSNTSTTPPNSPPPSSLPPAAPQPPAKDSASGIKPSAPRPAANASAANATLSQWEATMLGVKPNPAAAPMAEPTPAAALVSLKVNPSSPIAAHALASKPFSKEAAVTKPAAAARNFTEIPADLFMGPSRDAQLQPPAPVPATRQSSVTTISTQASYTDSIFSTQGSHGVADTQPTDYGLSQEVLPTPAEVKAMAKPEQPAAPPAPKPFIRPESAMDEDSRASTPAFSSDDAGSSQSDLGAGGSAGLFAYASHFVSKAFGAGSAKKPPKADGPIKVFENAAAAKKEQEEKEKKKVERKEVMEARRLAVSQKKQEEDRARQLEHEKKVKEEIERRKREREEMNASKLGAKAKKMDEPEAKKRKITAEVERKPELKKQPSKDKLNTSFQAAGSSGLPRFNAARPPQQVAQPSSQPVGKTLVKKPSGNLGSTSNPYTQSAMRGPSFGKLPPVGASKTFGNVQTSEAGPSKPTKTFTGPVKGKAPEFSAPSALKSAAGKARPPPAMQIALKNVVASEDIVLEEPNSEYSDSEDEGRNKGRPSWTQSPNLRQALEEQAQFNPDLIFGPIPQLDMGEMFPQRKFRPRSSSANWEGHALSKEEQVKYNEKMGYMGNIAE